MLDQYLASTHRHRSPPLVRSRTQSVYSAARTNATNSQDLCTHSSLLLQRSSEVYGQQTISNTTKPHEVWWQSGEVLVDTSSTLPQRQVTADAPPPLTADSFDGNTGQPGAIPDDEFRSGYNQYVITQHGQITLTRYRPPEWGFDFSGASVQLCHSHIVDPFSSNVYSNQIQVLKADRPDPDMGLEIARNSKNRGKALRVYYCVDCHKGYPRPQELKRHTRDKHAQKHKCPFCCTGWTRPERIRTHLLKNHLGLLSENEQQQIHRLRGLNDTTRFLAHMASYV